MNIFEKLQDFESQTLSQITYNMIKWFNFEEIEHTTKFRPNVESGVWISLKIVKGQTTWYVDGQRIDIVKKRLIEFLNKEIPPLTP